MFSFTPINKALSIALFSVSAIASTPALALTDLSATGTPMVAVAPIADVSQWDITATYSKGDKVTHNNKTYVAAWNLTKTGKEPGVAAAWKIADDVVSPGAPWDATAIYSKNAEVTYNGATYVAAWNLTKAGKEPGVAGVWKIVDHAWNATAIYSKGAEVTYKGATYVAAWNLTKAGKKPGVAGVWKLVDAVVTPDGPWDATAIYSKGAEVTYQGVTYVAAWNLTKAGKEPGVAGVWKVVITPTEFFISPQGGDLGECNGLTRDSLADSVDGNCALSSYYELINPGSHKTNTEYKGGFEGGDIITLLNNEDGTQAEYDVSFQEKYSSSNFA